MVSKCTEYEEWAGNQKLQDAFCKSLEVAELKRTGDQYDPKSGGPRTYLAQLFCLGLIFHRANKKIHLTKAGEDLAKGSAPLPILQHQLLTHQYPSAYSGNRNVKINPRLKVKPFLFILELLMNKDLGYLTNEEISIPMIYGHNRSCLKLCIEKILKLRTGKSLLEVIDDKEKDLYLPRSNGDIKQRLMNISDIGNTCKNYLQACCLISVDIDAGQQKYYVAEDMKHIIWSYLETADEFIDSDKGNESFQRAYGAWDRRKDTRRIKTERSERIISPEDGIILSHFYELAGKNLIKELPESFVDKMYLDFGFPKQKVRDVVQSHLPRSLDFFEATFLELSKSGIGGALDFEKAVCSLFEKKLHFKTKCTGQQRRKGKIGGYADVFAVALDNKHCAIIDAKASARYSLPASDCRAVMHDYIPNYLELTTNKSLKIEFGLFVAGGYKGNINTKLKRIKETSKIDCSAITARDILFIAKSNPSKKEQPRIRKFLKQSAHLLIEKY